MIITNLWRKVNLLKESFIDKWKSLESILFPAWNTKGSTNQGMYILYSKVGGKQCILYSKVGGKQCIIVR